MKDFWIGDYVRIVSKKVNGEYLGEKNGQHIVLGNNGQRYQVALIDLEIAKKNTVNLKLNKLINETETPDVTSPRQSTPEKIDLHIEHLNSSLQHALPARILQYQLEAFMDYLNKSYTARRPTILVIHGKGKGILKNEIMAILKHDERIRFVFDKNNGGAVEIWFKLD